METTTALTIFLLLLVAYIVPVIMADNRGRSMAGWFLITCVVTPFWAIVALLVLGKAKS